jgi:hypothetical protein
MAWESLARLRTSSNILIPIFTVGAVAWRGRRLQTLRIYEMVKDCTFQDMFGGFGVGLDSLALTQAQIKQFAKHRSDWLKKGGNGTFFLFKIGNEFFVAAVYFFSDGRLGVRVRDLTLERVFRAQKRRRLVVKSC